MTAGTILPRITERSRKAIQLAEQEATRLGHPYIGTEHLLLGLIREGDGVAARVLAHFVAPETLIAAIEHVTSVPAEGNSG